MNTVDPMSLANRWAGQLGLALSGLFADRDLPFGQNRHFALLDGVTASFGLSVAVNEIDPAETASFAWSSNLRKHVVSRSDQVQVISTARPRDIETYSLRTVEDQLDRFLDYLSDDRQAPSVSVVDAVIKLLDQYRSFALTNDPQEQDSRALEALLLDLAMRAEPSNANHQDVADRHAITIRNESETLGLLDRSRSLHAVLRDDTPELSLHANLAIRHASGAIFQRVTAALAPLPQLDIFSGAPSVKLGLPQSLRMGGYFTPAGLARSLAEASIVDKLQLGRLRICDPACGSGVFLGEVLRALTRANFAGEVELVGRDILPSAVEIARFVAKSAALDFDASRVQIDIQVSDSLTSDFGSDFDILLMNPPYRAWEQSTKPEREVIREIMSDRFYGKPDLSLAFAAKAFAALAPGGILATLLPIGVLTSDYSRPWRRMLCDQSEISLIGTLGDHFLFDYAMVNVATLVARKSAFSRPISSPVTMLWAGQGNRAASHALRWLRRAGYHPSTSSAADAQWKTYKVDQNELASRANWAPSPFGAEEVISSLRSRQFPRLEELFKVQQGIRAGSRQAFILSIDQWSELPLAEQGAFRPVAEKDGISNFEVRRDSMIFYSAGLDDPIASESEFAARFPVYFEQFIVPHRKELLARPRGVKLWELSWSRSWLRTPEPKIVSRMFVGRRQFGFAVDWIGDLAVVQGYGWRPQWRNIAGRSSIDEKRIILSVYSFLLASEVFYDMVRSVSVNIAGGQYDLAPKYINELPLPSWSSLSASIGSKVESTESVQELAKIFARDPRELERFARAAFSVS